MFDLVDFFGEGNFSHAMLQAALGEIDTLSELAGVLSVEEERQARHVLDLACVAHLDLVLVGLGVVAYDADWLPSILAVGEAGRDCVWLIWAHLAIADPLFDCSVLVPGIVPGQRLLRRGHRVLEDVILAVEDGACLNGGLVWVGVLGFFIAKFLLIFHMFVSRVDIHMSCW